MKNPAKLKLKRRGKGLYIKYFYNDEQLLEELIKEYDNNLPINEEKLSVIFNVPEDKINQIYELISYYPKKLKEIKYITLNAMNSLYEKYGDTIQIMKEANSVSNVRGKMMNGAKHRSLIYDIPFNIDAEDIVLNKECPILKIPLTYGNNSATKSSPSLDRIIPELGYVKGNIQVISMLANTMKSNATKDELLTFSNSMLEIYNITK